MLVNKETAEILSLDLNKEVLKKANIMENKEGK